MKYIKLTQGHFAVVDDEDYERLTRWKWRIQRSRDKLYASRSTRNSENYQSNVRLLHYEVMCLMEKLPPGFCVDHISGEGLDCRKGNLRLCTHEQNVWHAGPRRGKKHSKYKGVEYRPPQPPFKGGWVAYITKRGKRFYLGIYDDEHSAVIAYNVAAYRLFGKFAYLNHFDNPTRPEELKMYKNRKKFEMEFNEKIKQNQAK